MGELKHLSTLRKREQSRSSGERTGTGLNHPRVQAGRRCVGGVASRHGCGCYHITGAAVWIPKRLERRTAAGESPVRGRAVGEPPPLKYHATREIAWEAGPTTVQGYLLVVTDSAQYREGTVKSTPARGVKQSLKPTASMQ